MRDQPGKHRTTVVSDDDMAASLSGGTPDIREQAVFAVAAKVDAMARTLRVFRQSGHYNPTLSTERTAMILTGAGFSVADVMQEARDAV